MKGSPRSAKWEDWIAVACLLARDEDIKEGMMRKDVQKKIDIWLAAKGFEGISRQQSTPIVDRILELFVTGALTTRTDVSGKNTG